MSQNYDAFLWITPTKSNPNGEIYDGTSILWNYPSNISTILQSFQNIPAFCFPDLEMMKLEKPRSFQNEYFIFTLTDDNGVRIFGICLRTLDGGVKQKYGANRRPRNCLCFITKNPYFTMFKFALQEVHSLALFEQSTSPNTNAALHFLASLYSHKLLSKSGNFVIPPNPKCAWYNPLLLIPGTNAGAGKGVYSLAPLMEVLGVEKFFLILSAILCEERILFIADNIDTVSSAVHAVSAMLSPFQWQHLFLPILPSSLVAYTSSPFPFIIGIRRYQFTDQIKRALSDVIVVDADNGECTLLGDIEIKNFIAGEPIAPTQTTSSNLTETGMGLMRAGMQILRNSGISMEANPNSLANQTSTPQPGNPNAQTENVVQSLLNDIRNTMAKDPSKSYSARLGRSAADNSRDKWIAELDKTIRQSLLMFYVYLFGDINDDLNPGAARATLGEGQTGADSNRGVAKSGDSFGFGDSRAAFKLKDFINRRRQLGASASLIAFLEKFFHSQMFERFCAERILAFLNSVSIRKPTASANPRGSITQPPQPQLSKSASTTQKIEISSEYEKTCTELKIQHLSSTIVNIKYVIDEMARKQAKKGGVESVDNEFHQLALQITSNSLSTVTISLSAAKVDPNIQLREQFHQIAQDSLTDNVQFEKIMRVIWLRLDDCKGFNWKHGLRGLQLLHFLLVNGSAAVLTDALDHFRLLTVLKNYSSEFSSVCPAESRDQIKRTARQVIRLLLDHSLLTLQRRWIILNRLGVLQFNKLNQKILNQRKEECKKMNIAPFNPQSINQVPSFKNIHEVYRPPVRLGIPAAPHLITSEEKHKHDKPTLLIEGDDEPDIIAQVPDVANLTDPSVSNVKLGYDSFFTPSGELKMESSPKQKIDESPHSTSVQGFENFVASDHAPAADPFFGGSSDNAFGDPFSSSPRPASYNQSILPSNPMPKEASNRPTSLPTPAKKASFDPFSDPFTSSVPTPKPQEAKTSSSFDMFNDDHHAQPPSSDPFSDPFGGFSKSSSDAFGTSSKKNVDPFSDSFSSSKISDPFSDPFAPVTSSNDPFTAPLVSSRDPFTAPFGSSSTSQDPFSSSFSSPPQPFDPFSPTQAPVDPLPPAPAQQQPDIFGSGVLTPTNNFSAPPPKSAYHDPFADILGPDPSPVPPLPSGTMMPFVGIGTPAVPLTPVTPATQFDYTMLQPKQSTNKQQPQELDPFATLGGGNWSTRGGNSGGGRW